MGKIILWPCNPFPPKQWTKITVDEARKIFAEEEQVAIVESRDIDTGMLVKTHYTSWDCAMEVICRAKKVTSLWQKYVSPSVIDPRQITLGSYCSHIDPEVLQQYIEDCPPSTYSSHVVPPQHPYRAYICKCIVDVLYRRGYDIKMYCAPHYLAPIRAAAYAALGRCFRSCRQVDIKRRAE